MWYKRTDTLDENGQPVIDMGNQIFLPDGTELNSSNYDQYDGLDGWHYSEEVFTEEEKLAFVNDKEGMWSRLKNWFSGLF